MKKAKNTGVMAKMFFGPSKHVNPAMAQRKFVDFLTGDSWRREIVLETLKTLSNQSQLDGLYKNAVQNLNSWQKNSESLSYEVQVTNKDWGDATLESTKKFGVVYTVLNHASSYYPGGGFREGGTAQEENIFLRTTCSTTLNDPGVIFKSEEDIFLYDANKQMLLNAQEKMSETECTKLSMLRQETVKNAYKAYYLPKLQVCFRGPEFLVETSTVDTLSKNMYTADSWFSYFYLHQSQIFPFFELRSAAPELASQNVDWDNKAFEKYYEAEIRRRIAAQLDTLILNEKKNAVLGAWGCGCFKNKPETVALIYREELLKRKHCFDHVVFAILSTENAVNFTVFQDVLDGIKLSKRAKEIQNIVTKSSLFEPKSEPVNKKEEKKNDEENHCNIL